MADMDKDLKDLLDQINFLNVESREKLQHAGILTKKDLFVLTKEDVDKLQLKLLEVLCFSFLFAEIFFQCCCCCAKTDPPMIGKEAAQMYR